MGLGKHFPDSGQVLRFAQKWSVELMFYDKFTLLCAQKGVSCNKAATDMGLSNSTPTKWKKTGATPDGTTLAKISAYFGVSVGKLLTNESTGAIEFTVSTKEMQDYLQSKKKAPAPITESERNIVKIAGRDGSFVERRLTDDQVEALRSIIDQFPEAGDDI